jgi:tetratricopeptide (TPR) repeat protein
VSSGSGALRKFVMLGAPVLLLLAAAGWYGWQHRAEFFPNSNDQEGQEVDNSPILRATRLHKAGKTTLALKLLRGVSSVDPHHEEAQALIEQWQAELLPTVVESNADEVAAEEKERLTLDRQRRLVAAANQAAGERRNLRAVEIFEQAQRLAPLPAEAQQQLAQANRRLEPLENQLEFYRQGEWEVALRTLWPLHEDDPSNRDVVSLMVGSYYNLAMRDLQRGDAPLAAERLKESVELSPQDDELKRHLLFAQTYSDRPKDLQYWIYTKYLPSR